MKLDFPSLPYASVAPVTFPIVLAAEANSVRVKGRFLPGAIRMDEVGMGERGLNERCAAFLQIAFQRLNRRRKLTVVYAGIDQDEFSLLRSFGANQASPNVGIQILASHGQLQLSFPEAPIGVAGF